METTLCSEIKSVPRGRPRINFMESTEYQRKYYQENKARWQGGTYCDICKVNYSKRNKTRHMRSDYHKNSLLKSC